MNTNMLPATKEEMLEKGWSCPDFVFVTGDAYIDHPSFGCAILVRVLESAGYHVAVLAQPRWNNVDDFMRFGKPLYGFFVSAGVVDSMVNHYTVAKKPRNDDVYAPGGKRGYRPDRATIVYCNRIREAYGAIPIVIGGTEASLRRFAHYDYWDNRVRQSILVDSGANLLLYGMGEETILQAAQAMREDTLQSCRSDIRGACWLNSVKPNGYLSVPSYEDVSTDVRAYATAFAIQHQEQDPVRGRPLAQLHGKRWLCQNSPASPLSRESLDKVYALPYTRRWHPMYDALGGVPALEEVKFSITGTRGCFGSCSFCALTFHQGRVVSSRSPQSIVSEAEQLTHDPDFKGYIHDIGGPTANFRRPACQKQLGKGTCPQRQCLYPSPCSQLQADHAEFITILQKVRALPSIKKVFIRSGLRYDYILHDKKSNFLRELCAHHISGRLKVAPEHVSARVLALMGKPPMTVFNRFVQRFDAINTQLNMKQYVQPYLMSSHPGSDLLAAVELAEYLRDSGQHPDQVQDFYPTPGTLSTCMFYTGLDPRTMQPVHIPRTPHEKALQRALLQYRRPQNRALVREALAKAGRDDLIGYDKRCLVPPEVAAANRRRKTDEKKPGGASSGKSRAISRCKSPQPQNTLETKPTRNAKAERLGTRSPRAKGKSRSR